MSGLRPVVFAPAAERQLLELDRFIAAQSTPEIAARYVDAIISRCERLAAFPEIGTPRDDLRPGLRTLAFRRRVVVAYAVRHDRIEVLGIFYGGRTVAVPAN